MQDFIVSLVAFVLTFAQGGQPASTPPVNQENVVDRGAEVSSMAKDLAPQIGGTSNNVSESPENKAIVPNTDKVKAQNTASGNEMPAPLPQVAVDKSPVLENGTLLVTSDEVIYSLPEVSNQSQDPQLGKGIVEIVPEAPKNNGQDFGLQTSDSAKSIGLNIR